MWSFSYLLVRDFWFLILLRQKQVTFQNPKSYCFSWELDPSTTDWEFSSTGLILLSPEADVWRRDNKPAEALLTTLIRPSGLLQLWRPGRSKSLIKPWQFSHAIISCRRACRGWGVLQPFLIFTFCIMNLLWSTESSTWIRDLRYIRKRNLHSTSHHCYQNGICSSAAARHKLEQPRFPSKLHRG